MPFPLILSTMSSFADSRVTAVLGPTNTGKTYLAIERMLGHRSGMMGFPLRLLARENYDRVVEAKGARHVALVTGEEKIVPPSARYFLCTVESMPLDRPVSFLGVDEIQLCADPDRGHIFTDRLLHARGQEETMFLGADTIRRLLKKLAPEAEIITRPRFSTLRYSGARKLTRLPPRSAVVAFSVAEVYALAETLRRHRGGTAVVLGALSPRTRNAQVAMFEAGEVDYLVATDAIGMGLNLNLDHVAFAKLSKFDGHAMRRLSPAEIAQIAGRAGRHMSDGSFGTTGEAGSLEPELVEAVEAHRFDPLPALYWRSRELDFQSPKALLKSLERRPRVPELTHAREADDLRALAALARDPEIATLADNPGAIRLLWEVCQVPDFQKILSDQHASLLGRMFRYLAAPEARLPEDWVAREIDRLDRNDGDIDTLTARIAHIRTWTYVTHRVDWLEDGAHWQGRAREIEDKLSDALHERLTERFVDRRTANLVSRLRAGGELLAAVKRDGTVLVEGEVAGQLEGFHFRLRGEISGSAVSGPDVKPLLTAVRRVLATEIPARLARLERDEDAAFALDGLGNLTWNGEIVARLAAGETALAPRVAPLASEFLDGRARERLRLRLAAWLRQHLGDRLAPLTRIAAAARGGTGPNNGGNNGGNNGSGNGGGGKLSGAARGLLFQLTESLGLVPRRAAATQLRGLTRADRKALGVLGLRLGRESVFLPELLESGPPQLNQARPSPTQLCALLCAVHSRRTLPDLPAPGLRTFEPGPDLDDSLCQALGYRRLASGTGSRVALRADALERLAHEAYRLSEQGSFATTPRLARLIGCGAAELEIALAAIGYRVQRDDTGVSFSRARPRKNSKHGVKRGAKKGSGTRSSVDSPFAKLRDLEPGNTKGR
jgi:ATP-dependent RNA helicase SUPV3L1/SUV3